MASGAATGLFIFIGVLVAAYLFVDLTRKR